VNAWHALIEQRQTDAWVRAILPAARKSFAEVRLSLYDHFRWDPKFCSVPDVTSARMTCAVGKGQADSLVSAPVYYDEWETFDCLHPRGAQGGVDAPDRCSANVGLSNTLQKLAKDPSTFGLNFTGINIAKATINNFRQIAMAANGTAVLAPWVGFKSFMFDYRCPGFGQPHDYPSSPGCPEPDGYWEERVLHYGLTGAARFYYFNVFFECVYSKRSTHEDDDAMSASLAELDIVIGCPAAERRWIPDSSLGWGSSFILSGMEVGSRRVAWRFTPSLPLQINCKSTGVPNNKTKWDPRVLVSYVNDSLTLGPLKIDHDGRLLEDCVIGFEHGAVLDIFPRPSVRREVQLLPDVPTTSAAPFGLWIVQPPSAAALSVSCMAGHWHGMTPFEASWPLSATPQPPKFKSDEYISTSATEAADGVSQLAAALAGQQFAVTIAAGGAAVLTDSVSGEHLTTLTSSFSRPGPVWQNFSVEPSTSPIWQVAVNYSQAASGRWTVVGTLSCVEAAYKVQRLYVLDPAPPLRPRRLLINDTIGTPFLSDTRKQHAIPAGPAAGVLGIAVHHRATVASSAADVETAVIPGACSGQQCGTEPNQDETCGVGCFDSTVKRTNYGRPDVFANRTASASGGAFGIGLVALDNVFRVHAQTLQTAMATGPRMAALNMSCSVSSPPAIQLSDPMLALRAKADHYTMEWALYAFRPHAPDTKGADAGNSCTDFYCFVNAQRHDSGAATIRIERTGFLGPSSSTHGDMSVWNGTGYSTCKNATDTRDPNKKPVRLIMNQTCWEHWDAQIFLAFIQKQGGPGGMVHINNGDMVTKTRAMLERYPCSEITIDGNHFVDPAQRPAIFDTYFAQVVNQTRAANALLPPGAPKHKTVFYTDNYASTGFNDSELFKDSWVTSVDGQQKAYHNCTKPGGKAKAQLLSFFADGKNSYSQMLRKYYALALEMGANGIFHDEFPASNFQYTYHAEWDNRTVFLDSSFAVRNAPLPSSLVLLGDAFEIEMARYIDDKDGIMICNGAPQTRSWLRNALTAKLPTINENENSQAWRALHTQLYTPIMLTRYGGNKHDSDPRYNHTDDCPGPSAVQRRICYIAPCLSFSDHLDYGALSMTYGSLWHNDTHENVYAQMVPTTPIEIGEEQ
jgi:hypothetical protein